MGRKAKLVLLALFFMLAMADAIYTAQAGVKQPITYHWLLNEADDAYLLCNGSLVVEINGHDSIHLICE